MSKRWDAVRGNAGFYITMAVCLVVIGVSSYYLLAEDRPEAEAETAEEGLPARDAYVSAPAPEITEDEEPSAETAAPMPAAAPELGEEEAPPAAAVLAPEILEEPPAPRMPSLEVSLNDTPVEAQAPIQVVSPLDGEVVTAFAMDQLVYNPTLQDWRTHDGVDIAAEEGAQVLAACAGTVLSVTDDAMMGTTVVLEHGDGLQTVYANLRSGAGVEAGEAVAAGQVIGAVGETAAAESAQGPHLHFAVSRDGESVDPQAFLKE